MDLPSPPLASRRVRPRPALRLEDVFRQHHTYVWRTLARLGVGAAQLDDATQDVFIVVHHRLADFEGRAKLTTWLFEITRRIALRYRHQRKRESGPVSLDHPDPHPSPDDRVSRLEALELMQTWLDELDDEKRIVFVLAEFEQLQGPQIAERLGVNVNTVYARLRGARRHLAKRSRRLVSLDLAVRPAAHSRRRTWVALGFGPVVSSTAVPAAALSTGIGISANAVAGFGLGAITMALTLRMLVPAQPTVTTPAEEAIAAADAVPPQTQARGVIPPTSRRSTPALATAARLAALDRAPPPRFVPVNTGPPTPARTTDTPAPPASLADELALFEKVQAADRRGSRTDTQTYVDQYLHQYPRGTFAAEAHAVARRLAQAP
ncbi:MAG: sigma-70 family RNA polymerase sigma factor [Deltaproteobacteria bacterium]|nr:sigma-70 family RNA polymerase sigma factor [Deltaproteobacteria bacterium]